MARTIAGAFLTLLAIGLAAPSARADCQHPADRPAIGVGIGATPADGPSKDLGAIPPPRPCDGPQCSGKAAPPMTPAPQPPPRAESWGRVIEPAPVDPLESGPRAPEGPAERPIRQASSIFHPPRLPR